MRIFTEMYPMLFPRTPAFGPNSLSCLPAVQARCDGNRSNSDCHWTLPPLPVNQSSMALHSVIMSHDFKQGSLWQLLTNVSSSRVHCHIVHLSSAKPLKQIQAARQAGAPLTVETTHHYLSLCAEDIPAGATQFKCCPPIRDSLNQVKE